MRYEDSAEYGGQQDQAAEAGPDDFEDAVEVEHQGQIYAVPAALQEVLRAGADVDQREKALAEHARGVSMRQRALAEAESLAEQGLADRAQLHVLDLQLAAFAEIDWRSLEAEDPERAAALWKYFQQSRAVRAEFAHAIAQTHDQRRLRGERERAEMMAEAGQVLSREIEGWSPDVAKKLVEYAAAFGVTIDELREVADHRLWRILHKAYQGDEQSKQQAASAATERAQAVRPAVVVAGAAARSGGVRDELGTGEWMRRRNAQAASAYAR
jgi:hypothetical protein